MAGATRSGPMRMVIALTSVVAIASACATPGATPSDELPSESMTAPPSQPPPTQASPTPELPSATQSASPGPQWDYSIIWTQAAWSGRVEAVAYDEELGLWLALGWNEMWTSSDGASWERHTFTCDRCDDEPQGDGTAWPAFMAGVTRRGGALLAVGVGYFAGDWRELLLWTSSDGATWTEVPQEEPMWAVARGIATNGSVLAVAANYFAGGTGAVLTSTSGTSWRERQPGGSAAMLDVYGDEDGFVAVGYREYPQPEPVIWISRDGADWTDASPPGARGVLRSVARLPTGVYLAAGGDGNGSLVVWRSRNGVDWQSVSISAIPADPDWPGVRLRAAAAETVLIAATANGMQAWVSDDGVRWDEAGGFQGSATFLYTLSLAFRGEEMLTFVGEDSLLWIGKLSRSE